MYLVSIIIPVYNSEDYLQKCIESVMNQTYRELEIILVNDGSRDKSLNIINSYLNIDNRIKVISQKNSGQSIARNRGIEVSNGKYIVFCDADDYLEEEYIKILVEKLEVFNSDIVTVGYIDISKYGIIKLNDFYKDKEGISKDEFIDRVFNGVGGTLWGKIFKKDIIDNYNLKLDPNIYMCEDMIFVIQYSILCEKFSSIDDNLYNYNRLNQKSISSNIKLTYYANMIEVISKIESILRKNNFTEKYIDKIISEKVKNTLINFTYILVKKKMGKTQKKKIEKVKEMMENNYVRKFSNNFIYKNINERIVVTLLLHEKYKLLSWYINIRYSSRNIKEIIKFLK